MNVANKLTVSRIFLIPVFLVLVVIAQKMPEVWWGVFIVYSISGLTDLLDGRVARSQKQVTVFGSLIDPIADKLTIVSGLLMANQAGLLTIWVSVIIFSREFVVDGVRLIASGQKCKVISASWLGKIKTATQFIGLILLFIAASGTFLTGYLLCIGQYIMYFSTVIAVWGMFDYISKNRDILRDSLKEK